MRLPRGDLRSPLDVLDADHGCNDPREERVTANPMRFHGEAMAGLAPFRLGDQPTTDQS
jgi:hypothetical protein